MGKNLILWCVLIAVGFFVGFVPEGSRARHLNSQLSRTRLQINSCQSSFRLSDARNLLVMSYLEANEKNYGVSSGYSSRFFDQVRAIVDETKDAGLKDSLKEVLAARDSVTAGLARGDPSVIDKLGALLLRTNQQSSQGGGNDSTKATG